MAEEIQLVRLYPPSEAQNAVLRTCSSGALRFTIVNPCSLLVQNPIG
jgi:hypothetical protein